jgi:hypothetical protein
MFFFLLRAPTERSECVWKRRFETLILRPQYATCRATVMSTTAHGRHCETSWRTACWRSLAQQPLAERSVHEAISPVMLARHDGRLERTVGAQASPSLGVQDARPPSTRAQDSPCTRARVWPVVTEGTPPVYIPTRFEHVLTHRLDPATLMSREQGILVPHSTAG